MDPGPKGQTAKVKGMLSRLRSVVLIGLHLLLAIRFWIALFLLMVFSALDWCILLYRPRGRKSWAEKLFRSYNVVGKDQKEEQKIWGGNTTIGRGCQTAWNWRNDDFTRSAPGMHLRKELLQGFLYETCAISQDNRFQKDELAVPQLRQQFLCAQSNQQLDCRHLFWQPTRINAVSYYCSNWVLSVCHQEHKIEDSIGKDVDSLCIFPEQHCSHIAQAKAIFKIYIIFGISSWNLPNSRHWTLDIFDCLCQSGHTLSAAQGLLSQLVLHSLSCHHY